MPTANVRKPLRLSLTPREAPFTFVNVTHPADVQTESVQSRIHRHAMRYIGRTKRRKPRAIVIPLEIEAPTNANETETSSESISNFAARNVPVLHSPNPSGIFSIENDPKALELIHFACNEWDGFYRPFRHLFLRMALFDVAACNLVLANAVVFLGYLQHGSNSSFETVEDSARYYSLSLNTLQSRLGDPSECLSEGVFATVIGFLCHDANIQNWDRWRSHMAGLRMLSTLRGGLNGLGNHIPLLAPWLDLVGAVVLDQRPMFNLPDELCSSLNMRIPGIIPTGKLLSCGEIPDSLIEIMCMMSSIADCVNLHGHDPSFWKLDIDAIALLGPTAHQLSLMPRLGDTIKVHQNWRLRLLQELIRLTCLMILARLKERFSFHASEMELLQDKLIALMNWCDDTWAEDHLELSIWGLFTSALLVSEDKSTAIVQQLRKLMALSGLTSAESVIASARRLVWFNAFLNESGCELTSKLEKDV